MGTYKELILLHLDAAKEELEMCYYWWSAAHLQQAWYWMDVAIKYDWKRDTNGR